MRRMNWTVAALLGLAAVCQAAGAGPSAEEVYLAAAKAGEGVWRSVQKTPVPANQTSRELYRYALVLCEAKQNPERLKKLFEVAAAMQDRDPNHKGFGNYLWNLKQTEVSDYNAVDFCMQTASVLMLRHRDSIPADARKVLDESVDFAIQGLLRHKVSESYTNIALMNSQCLILLGEMLDRKDVAAEGYARFDKVCAYTWQYGIHEYDSPTYYGCDLECLVFIHAFTKNARAKAQAAAMLELFWTDIAANWFAPAQRLGGANSRNYDFVRGRGHLDGFLQHIGWLNRESRSEGIAFVPVLGGYQVSDKIKEFATRFPRLVRSSWGPGKDESRTHYLLPDITLSTAGALYHNMDFPLTVDLSDSNARGYFIADGRMDPFGTKKIPEGATGTHNKSLHLKPFWAGAQNKTDALGLTIYRQKDALPKEANMLLSHFVLPLSGEEYWIGEKKVAITPGKAAEFDVALGEAVCLVRGPAAMGVKVIWARDVDGKAVTSAKLAYDPKEQYSAMRLTVTHHTAEAFPPNGKNAGAAFAVRIGDGLKDAASLEAWRKQFALARFQSQCDGEKVSISFAASEGPLAIEAAAPFAECIRVEPASFRGVLEVGGKDVGKAILKDVEPMKSNPDAGKIVPKPPARPRK